MKKIVVLVLVLLMAAGASAFATKGAGWAFGLEGQFGYGYGGMGGGGALVLHTPYVPLHFGLNFSFPFYLGITADYWLMHQNLAGMFDWYLGVGGYVGLPDPIALGVRVPIGLQAWILGNEKLEVFLEVAPAIGVKFTNDLLFWNVQGALGFRYWL